MNTSIPTISADRRSSNIESESANGVSHAITEAYGKSWPFAVDARAPLRGDDIVILVIGLIGAGKSKFIYSVTKYGIEIGHSLHPCTDSIVMVRVPSQSPERYGDLVLVDTPGFGSFHETEILEHICSWHQDSGAKLSGLLYFHRICDNTLSLRGAALPRALRSMFEKLIGKSRYNRVALVTSMWDRVDDEKGRTREQEIAQLYWKEMILCGAQMKRFIQDQVGGQSRFAILEPIISAAAKEHQKAASFRSHQQDRRQLSIPRFFAPRTQSSPPSQAVPPGHKAQSGYRLPKLWGRQRDPKLERTANNKTTTDPKDPERDG